jgi:hypothetical protein
MKCRLRCCFQNQALSPGCIVVNLESLVKTYGKADQNNPQARDRE